MSVTTETSTSQRRYRPVRYRLEYLFVVMLRLAVRLMPRRCLLVLGVGVGAIFHRFDHRRRETAVNNVRAAFPDLSAGESRLIAKRAFFTLGRHALDLLRFDTMQVKQMMELVEIEGGHRVEQALADGRGVIFCGGHFGFWELQIMVHAAKFGQVVMVARSLDNPWLESMIGHMRARIGTRVVPRQGAVRSLLRALIEHQSIGVMADQHIQDRSAVVVQFMGRPAATTSTIAALALRTGVPVIPVFALPLPGGRYRMIYEAPVEMPDPKSPEAVLDFTQRCSDVLETYVRRYPQLWLWMHRRWRIDQSPIEQTLCSEKVGGRGER